MSVLHHITFEATAEAPQVDPLRMDIPLFVGHLTAKGPVPAQSELAKLWVQQGYLNEAEKAETERAGGEIAIYDRPLRLTSASDVARYFEDQRINQRAVVTGQPPRGPLAGAEFAVVVDGSLRSLTLTEDDPALAAREIGLAWPDLQVVFTDRLTLSLPDAHGAGTLAVLEHAGLGFATSRFTAAQSVGHITSASLRQFFAMGGREAYLVSMGPATPVFAQADERALALGAQIAAPGLDVDDPVLALRQGLPAPHAERAALSGIGHLLGLEDASFLVLPELLDLTSAARVPEPAPTGGPAAPVEFAACVPAPVAAPENHLRYLDVPALDSKGLALWQGGIGRCLDLIKTHRRDVMMLGACPVLTPGTQAPDMPRSAFLQLAAPFAKTSYSVDLPSAVLGADAVLAGQIAARLVSDAPYQSAALAVVPLLRDTVSGRLADVPTCDFSVTRGVARLGTDITTAEDAAWRSGLASRLAARLFRAAKVYGETLVFEPISDALMRRVQQRFERMLEAIAAAGGLQAGETDPGYSVICDRSIISPADIENGRLRVDVSFRPSHPVEMIRVVLPIGPSEGARP